MILGMQIRKPFQVDSPVFPWVWSILVDAADVVVHEPRVVVRVHVRDHAALDFSVGIWCPIVLPASLGIPGCNILA